MNENEKRIFAYELIDTVKSEIIGKIAEMPEEWDGHELRKFIADRFALCILGNHMTDKKSKRYRAYKNTILTTNLL